MDLVADPITDQHDCTLWGSCGGLLAFWSCHYKRNCISIVNPITREKRDISTPSVYGYPCGFFFDNFPGRYKLLYGHNVPNNSNRDHDHVYYTFDLSESIWRKLDMIKSCLDSRPNCRYPGVVVGDALYWIPHSSYHHYCSKMVVVFKIETEELYSLPHPPVTTWGNNGDNLISDTTRCRFSTHESFMNLIAKDGQLCLCHTIFEERVVDLWILEDYENWGSWVKKFKVNLASINKVFRRDIPPYVLQGLRIGSPQHGSNEILVTCIRGFWNGLYGYNLETHRSRQLESIESMRHVDNYVLLPYTKTMLSPMFEAIPV